jgi:cobalt/nickel transport system permease protein
MAEAAGRVEAAGVLETAATRRSVLEAIDGRVRIVAVGVFAIVVVSLGRFGPLVVALMGAMTALLIAHLPIARTLRRVVAMDTFIVLMIAMLPFTTPGQPVFSVFGFPASAEGFHAAILIALKANAVVLMTLALLSSLEPVAFGRALYRLGAPERLVHLILFNIRYIDVLDREQKRLRLAMRARGFRPANSRHTYVSYGYLVGMMLIRALERSERILNAMKCRGFSGRLFLDADERIGFGGVVFASACALFMAGLVFWEAIAVGSAP